MGFTKLKKKIRVKVKTLDSLLVNQKFNNSLMKIDVQGFEYQVLLGAVKSLKKIQYLIIEISSVDIYENQTNKKKLLLFLKNNNFKLFKIYNKSKLSKNIFQYTSIVYLIIFFTPLLPGGAMFSTFNGALFWIVFSVANLNFNKKLY